MFFIIESVIKIVENSRDLGVVTAGVLLDVLFPLIRFLFTGPRDLADVWFVTGLSQSLSLCCLLNIPDPRCLRRILTRGDWGLSTRIAVVVTVRSVGIVNVVVYVVV